MSTALSTKIWSIFDLMSEKSAIRYPDPLPMTRA
jgi:hypothetical protein